MHADKLWMNEVFRHQHRSDDGIDWNCLWQYMIELCWKDYRRKEGVARILGKIMCVITWENEMKYKKKLYKHFIDDGFGLWTHGMNELMKLFDYENKTHEDIKIELRLNTTKTYFLVLQIQLEDGSMETDLYS